jgi:hypothetical protein
MSLLERVGPVFLHDSSADAAPAKSMQKAAATITIRCM